MKAQTLDRATPAAPTATADPRVGKYLTFKLGKEEVRYSGPERPGNLGVQDITAVPGTPAHL